MFVVELNEYLAVKYLDHLKERRCWSGKNKNNSYKFLTVIDHSDHEFVAVNGAIEGDDFL